MQNKGNHSNSRKSHGGNPAAEPVVTVHQRKLINRRNLIKDAIIFVIVFCLIIMFFKVVKFPKIKGNSMAPHYYDGERVIAVMTDDVEVGDVVIAWENRLDENGEYIIKRVIGVAGDHIRIADGHLYRNGTMVYEDYINDQSWGSDENIDITILENEVFLLGDNRNHSTDSRRLGATSIENIKMKVVAKADFVKTLRGE